MHISILSEESLVLIHGLMIQTTDTDKHTQRKRDEKKGIKQKVMGNDYDSLSIADEQKMQRK